LATLEEAINGVENMTYMTSNATNTGSAWISIFFKQGTDPFYINLRPEILRISGVGEVQSYSTPI
jgi:multidrug efflux pump subunit AcrB